VRLDHKKRVIGLSADGVSGQFLLDYGATGSSLSTSAFAASDRSIRNAALSLPGVTNPFFNYDSYYDPIFVDTMFAGMASGGAKIVRIWVFPPLQGIHLGQCNSTNAQTVGLTTDLLANLQDVLGRAKKYNLKVYLTALNVNNMNVATGSLRIYFSKLKAAGGRHGKPRGLGDNGTEAAVPQSSSKQTRTDVSSPASGGRRCQAETSTGAEPLVVEI
jgi:hypothetical protein